jgi:Flp pilus assembly pilin Flp
LTRGFLEDEGQSTVEYLVVLIGIVAVVVGLGSILGAASRGVFGGLATKSASHATGGQDSAIAVAEVFLF